MAALVSEGFSSRLSFGLLSFALPLYGRSLGLSIAAISVLATLSTLVSLLLKPSFGGLADRFGLRRALLWSLVARSLLSLGYALAAVPWQLYAVRGAHGVSDAMRAPAVNALLAENGGKSSMASAFAWYQTAKTSAGAVGRSLAGALLSATAGGFGLVFGVAFALSLLPAVVVAVLVPRDARGAGSAAVAPAVGAPEAGAPAAAGAVAPPTGARRSTVLRYAGLGFLVSGSASMLTTLFPLLATEYAGLTPAQAGALYLVTPLLALTGPGWGRLADRVSRSLVLSVRSVANISSALLYLFFPSLAGIWIGKSLDDLGKAAFRPAWGSLMASISGQDRRTRGRTMGYLSAGEDAGDVVTPILAGLLWTGFGVPAALIGRVVLSVVAEGYAIWLGSHDDPEGGARTRRQARPAGRHGRRSILGWRPSRRPGDHRRGGAAHR